MNVNGGYYYDDQKLMENYYEFLQEEGFQYFFDEESANTELGEDLLDDGYYWEQWESISVCSDNNEYKMIIMAPNNLDGFLPPELFLFVPSLEKMIMPFNSMLGGTIATEIGLLSNLVDIILDETSFSGSFPSEIGNLQNLATLDFYYGFLSGTLPSGEYGNSLFERL